MTDKSIDTLNDVTKTLIDSHKGYTDAMEMVNEDYFLRTQFAQRAQDRKQLIDQFQSAVRSMGGTPQESGGMAASAHRGWMKFTSMFQDDEKAALGSIDDGEEHLANQIEDKLKDDDLALEARKLLELAHASAKEGESFADMMEDRA